MMHAETMRFTAILACVGLLLSLTGMQEAEPSTEELDEFCGKGVLKMTYFDAEGNLTSWECVDSFEPVHVAGPAP